MFEKEIVRLHVIDCSVTCRLRMLGKEQGTRGTVSEVTVSVFFSEYLRHMSLGTTATDLTVDFRFTVHPIPCPAQPEGRKLASGLLLIGLLNS